MTEWRVIHHAIDERGMVWIEVREQYAASTPDGEFPEEILVYRLHLIDDKGVHHIETHTDAEVCEIAKVWTAEWKKVFK